MYLTLKIRNQLYSKTFLAFCSNSSLCLKFTTVDRRSTACLWKFSAIKPFTMILSCRLCSKVKQTSEQPKLQQWFLFDVLLYICYKYIGVSNRNWSAFSLQFQNWIWHKVRTTGKCLNNTSPFISFQWINTQKPQNSRNSLQQNTQRPILLEWQTNSNTYQWISNVINHKI
jgi:hypothetical protein